MVRPAVRGRSTDTQLVSDEGHARVTFLGHSSIVIDVDGQRIVTDPILRPRVGPLRRAAVLPRSELWADPDAILISHSHWDHLDFGSLELLGRETTLVVPQGLAARLHARGFRRTVELEPGEHHGVGTVRVQATHAEHRGFGPPVGGTERSIGFLIQGSTEIYFAGDTAYFDAMRELDLGLDLALMPVWGWGPTIRASEHLDPIGAARAVSVIRPRWAVPIHWGTLHPVGLRRIRPSTRIDPPHQFAQLVRRYAPATRVRVLGVGSSLELRAESRAPGQRRPSGAPP
jgi:L-ascorbate metabolism protein UlaG (beta-lactamase superfamily)